MKLKIAICDDDAKQREFLAGIAAAWAGRMRHLAQIRQYATAKAFLFDYDEEFPLKKPCSDQPSPESSGAWHKENVMLFDKLIARKVALFEQELLQKYYAEVENMYDKMRGWRHDYRHHIQAMKVHAAHGELEEIRQYLDMLDEDLTKVETIVRTGNRAADAVLNSKLSLAGERQIQVKADVRIPVQLTTPELDLCTIMGNLLDNAMEACMELPPQRRLIRIYMEMKGNFLYFALTNTAGGAKKSSFHTTKGPGRGLGLQRVDDIVKKLGGHVTRASEEEAFSTEVLLPQ